MNPGRNIELKARLPDLGAAREIARRVATDYAGLQQQTDTYFHCLRGRLKLREIAGRTAQLVWYDRPDQPNAKQSDYLLVEVAEPAALKQVLATALGVRVVVDKRREVFLHHNVRIHLDDVADLGAFLEFEAVLNDSIDDATGHDQIARLCRDFRIDPTKCEACSYSDLLAVSPVHQTNA